MNPIIRLSVFVAIFLSCIYAGAQGRKWDYALDRYETICNRCIDLRLRASSGEAVSSDELVDLLAELNHLKNSLQESGPEMSLSQRERFERIRHRYDGVFGQKRTRLLGEPYPQVVHAFVPVRASEGLPVRNRQRFAPIAPAPVRPAPKVHPGLLLYGGLPEGSVGMLVKMRVNSFGGFAKGSLVPGSPTASYMCGSDGITEEGGYIWTSGKETQARSSLAAGLLYAPLTFLEVYAGFGYGRKAVFWEDVSGKWANVSDFSRSGVCTDVGLILTWHHLSALVGVSVMRFRSPSFEFGLGVSF